MLATASAELMRAGLGGITAAAASSSSSSAAAAAETSSSETTSSTTSRRGIDSVLYYGTSRESTTTRGGGGSGSGSGSGTGVYVLIVTAAVTVASNNTGIGCLFGLGASALVVGRERWVSNGGGNGIEGERNGHRANVLGYSEL